MQVCMLYVNGIVPMALIVAVYTLAGGFAGVLAYGIVEPFIRSIIRPAQPAKHHW